MMSSHTNITEAETGILFNIQRFSVHDGPGIRTILFAKGCPLSCLWCSNPESQRFEPDLAYKRSHCIGVKQCGLCVEACPKQAIVSNDKGSISIDRSLCDNCGRCTEVCPANALIMFGKKYTFDELVKKVEEDGSFYWRSGGGPTISGGEPFAQPIFMGQLLEALKRKRYHAVVETCGYFDINAPGMEYFLKNTDFLFFDIKLMDSAKHKTYTGRSNQLILKNILEISKSFLDIEIVARTPIIPGVNDTEEEIEKIAKFLRNVKTLKDYELLNYHAFGVPKYFQIGRQYELTNLKPLGSKKMKKLQDLACKTLGLVHEKRVSK